MGGVCAAAAKANDARTAERSNIICLHSGGRSHTALDRRSNEVAPLGPRPVVISHIVEAEQVFQDKPRVARTLSDPAIRDYRLGAVDALARIELAKLNG